MGKDDDKNRKAILERRARFMAAALTATSGCDLFEKPQPCLSVVEVRPPDAGTPGDEAPPDRPPDIAPRPCLEPPSLPPQPCLSPRMPDDDGTIGQPQACLKIAAPSRRPCLTAAIEPAPEPTPDAGKRTRTKK
jgi:hypothetical protein